MHGFITVKELNEFLEKLKKFNFPENSIIELNCHTEDIRNAQHQNTNIGKKECWIHFNCEYEVEHPDKEGELKGMYDKAYIEAERDMLKDENEGLKEDLAELTKKLALYEPKKEPVKDILVSIPKKESLKNDTI
jgi:hypothetical protein